MTHFTDATRKKVVMQHIQDGRTLKSLAAEYGVSKASISNWVRACREECQTNKQTLFFIQIKVCSLLPLISRNFVKSGESHKV